jgi:hypothetical protein
MFQILTCFRAAGHFSAPHGTGVVGFGEACGVFGGRPDTFTLSFVNGKVVSHFDDTNSGRLGGADFGVQSTGNLIVEKGDILLKAAASDPGDVIFQTSDGFQKGRIWCDPVGNNTTLMLGVEGGTPVLTVSNTKVGVTGTLELLNRTTGSPVISMGEGLDYAEGFDVTKTEEVGPGSVLVIDPANAGKLTVSTVAYDTKVAGIVAGAKGLGSGVRLGTGQFDQNVALAGRVYCNVDATETAVRPGDLLTTSATAGYAMKVSGHLRAQGAILGKAMESLEQGKKGQILVLVTLQ